MLTKFYGSGEERMMKNLDAFSLISPHTANSLAFKHKVMN